MPRLFWGAFPSRPFSDGYNTNALRVTLIVKTTGMSIVVGKALALSSFIVVLIRYTLPSKVIAPNNLCTNWLKL